MFLDKRLKNRINASLDELNSVRPLPPAVVNKLKEQFQLEMTYNSNSIEGNSLTLKETFFVVNEGITIKGKPLKDHLEAKDHYEATEFLYDLISNDTKTELSEKLIRELHTLIMKKTDDVWAGRYREGNVVIAGSTHIPPEAVKLKAQMNGLISWYNENRDKLHIVELVALLHHKLVYIHPFFDGNGRTTRLLINVLLMQEGYPMAVILRNDRRVYYRVLSRADKGDFAPLVNFIGNAVERSLNIYLGALGNKEELLPLSKLSEKVDYSAKYLNLLVRKGKIKAHKRGRIWVSSLDAIQDYLDSLQG